MVVLIYIKKLKLFYILGCFDDDFEILSLVCVRDVERGSEGSEGR